MPIPPRRIAFFISLALAASLPHAQARGEIERAPIDGYFTQQATTYNGLQVAKVLEPALVRLLESGQLTSEQIKALEKLNAELAQHTHPFSARAVVVQGEMWLTVAGHTRHLLPGDTFTLERDVPHSERYGAQGAAYWVARRNG